MLIECLTRRDGPTTIRYGDFELVFTQNDKGHSVCDVAGEGAVDYLLRSDSFRVYEPEKSPPQEEPGIDRDEVIRQMLADDKSYSQIGKVLGCSKATISLRVKAMREAGTL